MKHWYILVAWFGEGVQAMALVRAKCADDAIGERPYGWRDFVEPVGPGIVKAWQVEPLGTQQEIIINAVAATTTDS